MAIMLLFCLQMFIQVIAAESTIIYGNINDISFSNYVPFKGYRLSGTPLKKFDVEWFFDCLIECTANDRCLSANVNTTINAEGLLECELLDVDKYQAKNNNFVNAREIDHYALPVSLNEKVYHVLNQDF